jgi:hypothetical protein
VRIISEWHDYYDVVQKEGQDQTLIYRREQKSFPPEVDPPFPMLIPRWWHWQRLRPRGIVIGFCGKLYPIVKLVAGAAADYATTFCYSAAEVENWAQAQLKKKDAAEYVAAAKTKRKHRQSVATRMRVEIETFFRKVNEQRDNHGNVFEDQGVPIFKASTNGAHTRGKVIIETNPCLRLVEFYRVVDPYTAYQALATYLGAQAQPEKQIPHVADKTMVGAKGFDEWSFRKPPSKR